MNTKVLLHCGGGSNLILGIGKGGNIFSNNSSRNQFFSSNSQEMNWCKKKKNHYPHKCICIAHIWSPTLFPRGILIFQGALTKFNFLTKFQHMKKYYIDLMKDPKYEHQSTFALWGRVKLNFRDMYRKPHIYSKNSSRYQFFHQILKK